MTRTAREVLDDHLRLRRSGKLEEDLRRNYHEDVVMITADGATRGKDAVRECAEKLDQAILDPARYKYDLILCDDRLAMLEWSADGDEMRIADGVDSFLIEDGLICGQTIRYTVVFSSLSKAHGARPSKSS